MKNKIWFLFLLLIPDLLLSQTAHTNWSKLSKKIAIYPDTKISAWLDRGIVSNMSPAGDGTYIIKLNLTPNKYYNFLFFGEAGPTPPQGLTPNYTYNDQVPSRGKILTSINSNGTGFNTNYAHYGTVGDNHDARRIVYVPKFGAGTNFYVFNNFSDKPSPPEKFEALPDDGKVILNWSQAKGYWGQVDANVIAGGSYLIYTNTSGATNNFGLLTNLQGNITSFTHTGLVNGTTYYYTIISSDSYSGPSGTALTNMKSDKIYAHTIPRGYIPVYFKVQDIRWDVVKKNRYLVWLTPAGYDGRYFFSKYPARILKVTIGSGEKG